MVRHFATFYKDLMAGKVFHFSYVEIQSINVNPKKPALPRSMMIPRIERIINHTITGDIEKVFEKLYSVSLFFKVIFDLVIFGMRLLSSVTYSLYSYIFKRLCRLDKALFLNTQTKHLGFWEGFIS